MKRLGRRIREKTKAIPAHWFLAAAAVLALIVLADVNISLKKQLDNTNAELADTKEILGKEMDKNGTKDENETIPVITSETIKKQLNGLSELVTQEYTYRNADRRESSETWIFGWTRPFSSKSILITYDGTIKAGIDFSKIDVHVDEEARIITVKIPKSTITDHNIPQDGIEVLEVKNGLFNKVTFDNYNDFVSAQKEIMEEKAVAQGLLTKADGEARELVEKFLSMMPGMENYQLLIQ